MSLLHKAGVISVTKSVTTIILKDRGLYNLNLNEKKLLRTFQGSSDNGANEKEIVYAREFLTDKL